MCNVAQGISLVVGAVGAALFFLKPSWGMGMVSGPMVYASKESFCVAGQLKKCNESLLTNGFVALHGSTQQLDFYCEGAPLAKTLFSWAVLADSKNCS